MRAGWIGRTCVAAGLALVLGALPGCGGNSTPASPVGTNISFTVPVQAGSNATIRLRGTDRGAGRVGVVLAHMLGSSESAWAPLVKKLVDRGLHVLTFDFRGH